MSHAYGRRDGCSAAGMTAVGVGSGALLGVWEHAKTVTLKCTGVEEEDAVPMRDLIDFCCLTLRTA